MNEKMKITLLVLLITLLLAACGGAETPSAPVVEVTEEPTPVPEPVEVLPTAISSEEADSEQLTKYIGLVYPPSPENLTQVFSMLIQDKESFSLMMVLDGANKMLWLSKVAQYDASGNPLWEVADVLNLSNLESGLTLLPDGCSLNGVPDSEILVAGRNGVIVLAWRANTVLGKFEVIPTEGVQCNSDKAMPLD